MIHFKLSQKNENFYEIRRKTQLSTTDKKSQLYFNDLNIIRKPDNPIEGYLTRRFEVQISCQRHNANLY